VTKSERNLVEVIGCRSVQRCVYGIFNIHRRLRHGNHGRQLTTVWPLCPRDAWFSYSPEHDDDEHEPRHVPTPADHDRMLAALAWGRGLDRQQWMIARDRAAGYSDAMIADRAHVPVGTVARRYDAALDVVCAAALGMGR